MRVYSALRSKTLKQLTWRMMHLDANPPFAKTPAEINKSRREEKHAIRRDMAAMLHDSRNGADDDDLVFPNPPTLNDLRDDLKLAGVAFDDGKGNHRLDLHSFRRTLVKFAKQSGLSLEQASLLLGHKCIETTRKYYDEDVVNPELTNAVESLLTLG